MNKALKATLKITGIVLGSLIALVLLFYAVLWTIRGSRYEECKSLRQDVCGIPGLGDGFVPQGIAYSESEDVYVTTGYDGNDLAMLYLVDGETEKRVYIADENGNDLKGHGGGVTVAHDYVYIANGGVLQMYSLAELIAAEGETRVKSIGYRPSDNGTSFCFSDDTRLFVGEFYRAGNYETDKSHYFTAPSGETNKAIVSCYPLNTDGSIASDYPEYAISITELVQGFAVKGDTFILSRSYGLSDSSLDFYASPKDSGKKITLEYKKGNLAPKEVPLYYLDSSLLKKSLVLPSFSEDLDIVGDRVIVTNEAACDKYFIGKLFGAKTVYSYPILPQ